MALKKQQWLLIIVVAIAAIALLSNEHGDITLTRNSPTPLSDGWDYYDLVLYSNGYDPTPMIGSTTTVQVKVYPQPIVMTGSIPGYIDYFQEGSKYVQCGIFNRNNEETWLGGLSSAGTSRMGMMIADNCAATDLASQTWLVHFYEDEATPATVTMTLNVPDYGQNADYVLYCGTFEKCFQDGDVGYSDQFVIDINPESTFMDMMCDGYDEGDWRCVGNDYEQSCIDMGTGYADWTDPDACDDGESCSVYTGRCQTDYIEHASYTCFENDIWWYDSNGVRDSSMSSGMYISCTYGGCTAGRNYCNCYDVDGDGYGKPASPVCPQKTLDCEPTIKSINPGAKEVCGNNYDDDCDGTVNEDCQTTPGETHNYCKTCQGTSETTVDVGDFEDYASCFLGICNIPARCEDIKIDGVKPYATTAGVLKCSEEPGSTVNNTDLICYTCDATTGNVLTAAINPEDYKHTASLLSGDGLRCLFGGDCVAPDTCEEAHESFHTNNTGFECKKNIDPTDYELSEDPYINPADSDEWCVKNVLGKESCFPRKDNIYLTELDEIDESDNQFLAEMSTKLLGSDCGVHADTCSQYLEDDKSPLCVNNFGDVQCADGGECVAAQNTKSSANAENLKVYNAIKPLIINFKDHFANGALQLFTLGAANNQVEKEVEMYGVCAWTERDSFTLFKQKFAKFLGLSPTDPNLMWYMIGIAVLLLIFLRLLLSPSKR